MKYIPLVIVLFFICCKPELKIVNDGDNQPMLKGANLKELSDIFPRTIHLVDKKLIIVQRYDLPFISLFDLNQKKIISKFGTSKNLIDPLFFPMISGYAHTSKNKVLSIVDFKTNKVFAYNLDTIINKQLAIKPIHTTWLPTKLNLKYSSFLKISDQGFFANHNGTERNGRFFIFNTIDKSIKWLPYNVGDEEKISDHDLSGYYYSFISYNSELKRIGAAMKFFKRIDFFDTNGNVVTTSVFKPFNQNDPRYTPSMLQNPNSIVYYNESFAGSKFFYAICIDAKQIDYVANKGAMKLHVFDWNGNLKAAYKFDRMFLGGFVVDESTNKLYIVSFLKNDRKCPIIEYQLPKIN